jgi:hypothetical protein
MSGNVQAWIVDLDGTLALRTDRHWFDWHRVGEDLPNEPVVAVVRALITCGYQMIYMSGRKEQCRYQTTEWLSVNVSGTALAAPLFMRADGDNRPDEIVKRELFEKHIAGQFDVTGVIDDRSKVVSMWRNELGLTCFAVAEGNF